MKEGIAVLEHLNFLNKITSELLTVDVKIDKEDKALILFNSLPVSYDHIITTILCGKKILILEEITTILLSNEIRKRPNQDEQEGLCLVVMRRKGKREKKSLSLSKACHFYHQECH